LSIAAYGFYATTTAATIALAHSLGCANGAILMGVFTVLGLHVLLGGIIGGLLSYSGTGWRLAMAGAFVFVAINAGDLYRLNSLTGTIAV
jgi:hypothetical protein